MIEATYKWDAELAAFGVRFRWPCDAQAVLPPVSWIPTILDNVFMRHQVIVSEVQKLLKERGVLGEKWDCDNEALGFAYFAGVSRAISRVIENSGHAAGMAHISIGMNGYLGLPGPGVHDTGIVKCDDGEWYFAEVETKQYGKVKDLMESGAVTSFRYARV